jgi:hypothetical protein
MVDMPPVLHLVDDAAANGVRQKRWMLLMWTVLATLLLLLSMVLPAKGVVP